MRAINFAYWLQGFAEIANTTQMDEGSWKNIVEKLQTVVGEGNCDPFSHTLMPGDFVTWLRGFVDIAKRAPNEEEWKIIKEHLQLVFTKVVPSQQPMKEQSVTDEIKKALDKVSKDRIHPPTPWPKPPYDVTCRPKFCATPSANALTDYPEYPPEVLSES